MATRALPGWLNHGSLAIVFLSLLATSAAGEKSGRGVTVKIEDEKAVIVEADLPVDPTERIRFQPSGNFFLQINDLGGQSLHLSHFPTVKVDDVVHFPGSGAGRFEVNNAPLPKTLSGKVRKGHMNVWVIGDIRITQTVEFTPTKAPGPGMKRPLGAALIKYIIENKGTAPHKVGLRTYVDTFVIDNDQCQFAAPNRPGKILDGVEFTGKDVPDYVQCLQRPDLKDPGYVVHITFGLGGERPDSLVLSRHGASPDNWRMQVIGGGGDSALALFFDPRELKPGGKREVMYAYGAGVATPVASEGKVQIALSGSWEKGRTVNITALVTDPVLGQSLELGLPKGLTLVEGREVQPVPEVLGENPHSLVLWKCRVDEYGRFPIRIKSSTGVTQTKVVTLTPG